MRRLPVVALAIIVLLILVSIVLAQNGDFEVSWHRVAGGGALSNDETQFHLSGTIGQAEAGLSSNGSRFVLSGGYWDGTSGGLAREDVFLPLIISLQ